MEDAGVSWIPYESEINSAEVVNQPQSNMCVPSAGCQILLDNEGMSVAIKDIFNRLQGNGNLSVQGLGSVLNGILAENGIEAGYLAARFRADPEEAFNELISTGNSWVARVKPSLVQDYGHALVVRGVTEEGLVSVVDPWGLGPGSGEGTIGALTRGNFFRLWSHAGYIATFRRRGGDR